ncbi:F-box/WD repeat-containing protein 4 [Anabrus simplex]|uniref:F-box/WD repeat-containing protein 4 n=1 Tax=Anabrus simplex TaxID=316456 RepID=UPI0035A2DE42
MSDQRACAENAGENLLLENLPTDVLLLIFWYCDDVSLGRLSQQCKRFNDIISDDFLWAKRSRDAIVTNQITNEVQSRSFCSLSLRDKCRISANWKRGRFKEKIYFSHKTRYMPWLSLGSGILWLSKGTCILGYRRRHDGLYAQAPHFTLKGHSDDVCRFVATNDMIISGGRDGTLCGWCQATGQFLFCRRTSHSSDINSVSVSGNIFVSGSRDKTVKIWWYIDAEHRCNLLKTVDVHDRVWSVSCRPQGEMCAVGSAGYHHIPPLHIYDLQQGKEIVGLNGSFRPGAGILDIHWESPHTFLSTGYDAFIRLWDIRTGSNVNSWEDPFDSAIYCIDSDNLHTILCGMAQHGRVQLWDKRQHNSLQMYFMSANHSSPVYSLAFDPCQLFAALDQSLNVMDFSGYKNAAISYM